MRIDIFIISYVESVTHSGYMWKRRGDSKGEHEEEWFLALNLIIHFIWVFFT